MKRREEKKTGGACHQGLAGVRPVDEKKGRGQRKKSILGVEGV